jgi:gas vesicle protein
MTAADRFRRMSRYDDWSHYLSLTNVLLVGGVTMLIVAGLTWRSGKAAGEAIGRGAANAFIVHALADSSRGIEAREVARHEAIHFAERAEQNARAIHQIAREKIRLVSDTVIAVVRSTDTLRVDVPREVVTVIQASDSLHRADSTAIDLLHAQLADVSKDRDVWKHRALLDEDELKRVRPSRFGMKTGAVIGAVAVLAVGSLLR